LSRRDGMSHHVPPEDFTLYHCTFFCTFMSIVEKPLRNMANIFINLGFDCDDNSTKGRALYELRFVGFSPFSFHSSSGGC
jgi:hypothetical protein